MKFKFNKNTIIHIAALGLITCGLLAGCSSGESIERPELLEPANLRLETTKVARNDITNMAVYDASVVPETKEIGFGTDGYLYGLYVEPGQQLYEGDVIASIVGKDFNTIRNLEDNVEQTEKDNAELYKYLEAELELSRIAGEDVSELELTTAQDKALAELKLEQKKQKLEQLKENDIGYVYLEAPYDCKVIATANTRNGAYVSSSSPVIAVEEAGSLIVTCSYVSEKNINSLYNYYAVVDGEFYNMTYIPYSKDELSELAANSVSPVSKFRLDQEASEKLKAGTYCLVVMVSDQKEDVLSVPLNAVFTDSEGKFVYEVVDNNRIRRSIVTGLSDSTYVEIVEGIGEGASVYVKN